MLNQPMMLPCGAVLSNRIAKAALTEGMADARNHATSKHDSLYRRWSAGGAGLLMTGNVQVDRRFLERPGNISIDDEDLGMEALRSLAKAGTSNGNHFWMQLNHPGRQTLGAIHPTPLAPSAVPMMLPGFGRPIAMLQADIDDVIRRFGHGARVARETGFTGVQIHAAHGYLLSQFLNPQTNLREDSWGGILENRTRMLLSVVREVRRVVGRDFPVSVKLNSSDFQQGGFSPDECLTVVRWLSQEKIDLLEISGGSYESPRMINAGRLKQNNSKESTARREAYFIEYAESIRPYCAVPLMVTGGFRTRLAMEDALMSGAVDVIGLGRPMITSPECANGLIEGTVEQLPTHELSLKLETQGTELSLEESALAKMWSIQGWYAVQMLRMGEGGNPDCSLDVLTAFRQYQHHENIVARQRVTP